MNEITKLCSVHDHEIISDHEFNNKILQIDRKFRPIPKHLLDSVSCNLANIYFIALSSTYMLHFQLENKYAYQLRIGVSVYQPG
jgi:plasmid maintenance system killer protein